MAAPATILQFLLMVIAGWMSMLRIIISSEIIRAWLITPCAIVEGQALTVGRRSRLGGILNYYERLAA